MYNVYTIWFTVQFSENDRSKMVTILEKKYESPSIFCCKLMATDFRKYVTLEIKVATELAE